MTENRQPGCGFPAPGRLAQARAHLEQHRQENRLREITGQDILLALDGNQTEYFITTSLYWDCECLEDFQKPAGMLMCEQCEAFQEDHPDSRIGELRRNGIHLDLMDEAVRATLEAHGSARAQAPT